MLVRAAFKSLLASLRYFLNTCGALLADVGASDRVSSLAIDSASSSTKFSVSRGVISLSSDACAASLRVRDCSSAACCSTCACSSAKPASTASLVSWLTSAVTCASSALRRDTCSSNVICSGTACSTGSVNTSDSVNRSMRSLVWVSGAYLFAYVINSSRTCSRCAVSPRSLPEMRLRTAALGFTPRASSSTERSGIATAGWAARISSTRANSFVVRSDRPLFSGITASFCAFKNADCIAVGVATASAFTLSNIPCRSCSVSASCSCSSCT